MKHLQNTMEQNPGYLSGIPSANDPFKIIVVDIVGP